MAFRTDTIPAEALRKAKNLASSVRRRAVERSQQFNSTTGRDVVLTLAFELRRWRDDLAEVASTPGLSDYAAAQENDGTYDVVAEFNAMNGAIDAAITEIVNTFPTSSNGFVEERVLNADGNTTPGTFTVSQLAGLKARMDDIVAAIEA